MEIKIRRAADEDIPFVVDLWQRCYALPWSETAIKNEAADENSALFVALFRDELVGYALLKGAYDRGELCNIAVEPRFRRGGAGSALLREITREAATRGFCAVDLEVRESNAAAISLYEREGFLRVGQRRNYYRAPVENALLYTYNIKKEN